MCFLLPRLKKQMLITRAFLTSVTLFSKKDSHFFTSGSSQGPGSKRQKELPFICISFVYISTDLVYS